MELCAIDSNRCAPGDIPEDQRAAVVVAVDPSGAAGRDDLGADEIGIVVAARGFDGEAIFLTISPAAKHRRSGAGERSPPFMNIVPIASWLKAISAARWFARPYRQRIETYPYA